MLSPFRLLSVTLCTLLSRLSELVVACSNRLRGQRVFEVLIARVLYTDGVMGSLNARDKSCSPLFLRTCQVPFSTAMSAILRTC